MLQIPIFGSEINKIREMTKGLAVSMIPVRVVRIEDEMIERFQIQRQQLKTMIKRFGMQRQQMLWVEHLFTHKINASCWKMMTYVTVYVNL